MTEVWNCPECAKREGFCPVHRPVPLTDRSRCAIHGDSTESGRCASCDAEHPSWAYRDKIGRKVIFRYFHGEEEEGIVTSVNDKNVFVRFGNKAFSEACSPEMLRLAVP